MPHDQEIEIKFSCDAATMALVLKAEALKGPLAHHVKTLHTTYFDTTDHRLRQSNAILRVRWSDAKDPVLCIKSVPPEQSEAFHRREIESPSPQGLPDISLFGGETTQWLKNHLGSKRLHAQFELKVQRRTLLVAHGGAEIEISADEGVVISGDKTSPIVELELELKSGKDAGLFDLAARLVQEFPLALSFGTKSERGFRLIGEENADPVTIPPLSFSADMSLDDVIAACLSHTLYQFTAQWDAMSNGKISEAIHQMRVALRRLRTFLSIFSKAYPGQTFKDVKRQARDINLALGKARNLEVLSEVLDDLFEDVNFPLKKRKAVVDHITAQQDLAQVEARDLVHSRMGSHFVLHLQHLIATRGWTLEQEGTKKTASSGKFVSHALSQLHARVLKRGRGFAMLELEELHAVRLALKAMTHATNAFSSMIEQSDAADKFQSASLKLQKGLGSVNDAGFALQFLDDISNREGLISKDDAQALAETLKAQIEAKRAKLQRAWRRFKDLPPYWN